MRSGLVLSALLLLAAPRLNSALLSTRAVTKGGGLTLSPTNWDVGEGKDRWMHRGWTSPAGLAGSEGSEELLGVDAMGDHGLAEVRTPSCLSTSCVPPWSQPRGKPMVYSVSSHTNATRIGCHLWEIDLIFAPGLHPGWLGS